jgi:uncharacterized protein (DUF2147 family)
MPRSSIRRLSRHACIALGALSCALVFSPPVRAIGAPSPVGVWRTFDDSGRETGRVEITDQHGTLSGRIVGIIDAAKARGTCFKCSDDRKDQPAMGLQIIRGMHADGDRWDGGTVLDPENGRAYDATMRLADGGGRLVLRGYIGISLFGRTQTWERAP